MWKSVFMALMVLGALAAQPAPKQPAPKDPTPAEKPKPKEAVAAAAVSIKDRAYSPDKLTIKKGTTVTWTNNDDMDHTVDASDRSFSSGTIKKKGTFQYTFKTTGKFPYGCALHPRMKGTVTVQ